MTPLEPDPKTKVMISEFFAGKTCAVCGHPAQRLRSGPNFGDVFYCADCLPEGRLEHKAAYKERRSFEFRVPVVRDPKFGR